MNATIPEQRTREPTEAMPLESDNGDAELRDAAIASLKRKRRFSEDAVAYVAVNGVLWVIWALTDRSVDGNMPWPAWVSAIWGFFLAMDAWRAYAPWPRSLRRPMTDDDIDREMNRLRLP